MLCVSLLLSGSGTLSLLVDHAPRTLTRREPLIQRATLIRCLSDEDLTGDGGVLKTVLKTGNGDRPVHGARCEVHYVGRSFGKVFDSSRKRGKSFKFDLGFRQVIAGWDVGVASMNVGETASLTCSPKYGYGSEGAPPLIPPGAVLTFEIELLSATPPAEEFAAKDPTEIDYDDLQLLMDIRTWRIN